MAFNAIQKVLEGLAAVSPTQFDESNAQAAGDTAPSRAIKLASEKIPADGGTEKSTPNYATIISKIYEGEDVGAVMTGFVEYVAKNSGSKGMNRLFVDYLINIAATDQSKSQKVSDELVKFVNTPGLAELGLIFEDLAAQCNVKDVQATVKSIIVKAFDVASTSASDEVFFAAFKTAWLLRNGSTDVIFKFIDGYLQKGLSVENNSLEEKFGTAFLNAVGSISQSGNVAKLSRLMQVSVGLFMANPKLASIMKALLVMAKMNVEMEYTDPEDGSKEILPASEVLQFVFIDRFNALDDVKSAKVAYWTVKAIGGEFDQTLSDMIGFMVKSKHPTTAKAILLSLNELPDLKTDLKMIIGAYLDLYGRSDIKEIAIKDASDYHWLEQKIVKFITDPDLGLRVQALIADKDPTGPDRESGLDGFAEDNIDKIEAECRPFIAEYGLRAKGNAFASEEEAKKALEVKNGCERLIDRVRRELKAAANNYFINFSFSPVFANSDYEGFNLRQDMHATISGDVVFGSENAVRIFAGAGVTFDTNFNGGLVRAGIYIEQPWFTLRLPIEASYTYDTYDVPYYEMVINENGPAFGSEVDVPDSKTQILGVGIKPQIDFNIWKMADSDVGFGVFASLYAGIFTAHEEIEKMNHKLPSGAILGGNKVDFSGTTFGWDFGAYFMF